MKKGFKTKLGLSVAGATLLVNGCLTPGNVGNNDTATVSEPTFMSLFAPAEAHAFWDVPASTKGKKNFERAMAAEKRGADEKAAEYWSVAAEAYTQAQEEAKAEGKDMFASDTLKAGIAFAKAGMDEKAVETLKAALAADPNFGEANAFCGLCLARLGRVDEAKAMWEAFPAASGQRVIAVAVKEQLANINGGSTIDETALTVALNKAHAAQTKEDERPGGDGGGGSSSGGSGGGSGGGGGNSSI